MALHPILKGKTVKIQPLEKMTARQVLQSYMIWIKEWYGVVKYDLEKHDNGNYTLTFKEERWQIKD